MKNLSIILVSGGSSSGKSEFAKYFRNALILEMDHFYVAKKDLIKEPDGSVDFDRPEAVAIDECAAAVKLLSQHKAATIPIYNMRESDRVGTQIIKAEPHHKFLVIEGIFAFYSPLSEIADFKVFIDVPHEIRLARRLVRDAHLNRNKDKTLEWFTKVEVNYKKYIEPYKEQADWIIPFSYHTLEFWPAKTLQDHS